MDRFSQDSNDIPACSAEVFAGKGADQSFREKVAVTGTREHLSFNISIPLPPQQGMNCSIFYEFVSLSAVNLVPHNQR